MQGGKNFRGHSPWILPQEKSPGRSNANLLGSSGSRGASAGVRLPHLTGPPRRNPAAGSRQSRPPTPRGPLGPRPSPTAEAGVPQSPAPCPLLSGTDPRGGRQRKKGRAGEGGVTSGRSHSPRSGTFLGRGEGSGEGNGGEGGKEAPTPRAAPRARVFHRLATPGRRRTPERAWGRAQARLGLGGRPGGGGCAGTDLALGFPV